ncbi:MAG: hypothetical protein ABIH39_04560 [Candidatus Margulisiibacteriota bacterium]
MRNILIAGLIGIIAAGIALGSESLIIKEAISKKIIEEEYKTSDVLGKPSVEVNYFKNTSITCFVGHDVTTLVKLPYVIAEPPVLANLNFFKVQYKTGWNYFIIKPALPPAQSLGEGFNMHIICRDNEDKSFIVDLTFVIVPSDKANHTFEILDGEAEKLKKNITFNSLKEDKERLSGKLEEQDRVIHYFLYYDLVRADINESLTYRGTKLTLINITNSVDQYFYNFKIDTEDKGFNLDCLNIKLTFANYRKKLLSEDRDQGTVLKPERIINHGDYASIVFNSDTITNKHFYSDLEIGENFRFRDKIDLDETLLKGNIFGEYY